VRYGGNTACIEVRNARDDVVVLDAGTGIRRLGERLPPAIARVDLLLSHLHMDHIQGLGFFTVLFHQETDVHIRGPPSAVADLRACLSRYLSPPLFPVHVRDLRGVTFHDVLRGRVDVPGFRIDADLVCHPGPTVGYRLEADATVVTYLPDHEPALVADAGRRPEWRSGHDLAERADLLIHDAQYTASEYDERVGWGHSTVDHALDFALAVGARCLMPFHHDPSHDDGVLDGVFADLRSRAADRCSLLPAREDLTVDVADLGARPAQRTTRSVDA
jgi:ribonuclease BN (tRNA processing enzyme)